MSDVVGAAVVVIAPDAVDFGSELEAQLQPAFDAASAAASDAAAAISAVMEAAFADMGFASEQAVGVTTAALDEIITAASGAAGLIASEMDSAFLDVTTAADEAASNIGSALGESETAVAALGSSFADAGSEGAVAGGEISTGMDTATSGIDLALAATIALGVALGESLSSGVDMAVSKLGDLAGALPSIGAEFDDAFDRVRIRTGEFGDGVGGMQSSVRDLANKVPASFDDISLAVSGLGVRLDETGKPLEDLSEAMIRMSQLTGTSLQSNMDNISGVFKGFGVSVDDQVPKMNELFRVFQATGINVTELSAAMLKAGPVARLANVSFDDTASIMGLLTKSGLKAGQSQIAFGKILKYATDKGLDAKTGFSQVWKSIENGAINSEEAFKIFGVRSIGMFETIKAGRIPFEELSAQIQAGGDTLNAAGADTDDWAERLQILTNQLKLVVEPVARFVFDSITTALTHVAPIVVQVAKTVTDLLAPAFQAILFYGKPIWDLLGDLASAIGQLASDISNGESAWVIIANFFEGLTRNTDLAVSIADAFQTFADAATNLWTTLQPFRDALASIFDTISKAIADLIAANPGAFLIGFAVAISAVLLPILITLGGFLLGLAVTVAGFVAGIVLAAAPFILLGLAVAGLIIVFKNAYDNIQPFHDAVDALGRFLKENLLAAFTAVTDYVNNSVVPWVTNLADMIGKLWDAITSGDAQGVGEVLDNIFGNTGAFVDEFRNLATSVSDALTALQPVAQWFIDHWQIIAEVVGAAGVALLLLSSPLTAIPAAIAGVVAGLVWLYNTFEPVRNVVDGVGRAIGILLGFLGELAGGTISAAIDIFSGLINVLTGLFTFDWNKVTEGLGGIGSAILTLITTAIPAAFSAVGDIFTGPLTDLFNGLLGALGNIPIIGPIIDFLRNAFTSVGSALGNFGDILAGIFTFDGSKILAGLGDLRTTLGDFLVGVVNEIPALLLDALGLVTSAIGTVFGEWLPTALTAASDLIQSGLKSLFGFISTLPSVVGQLIVQYGPTVAKALIGGLLLALKVVFFDIPKWIITEALPSIGAALVEHGPAVLSAIGDLLGKIPQLLGSLLSGIGGILLTVVQGLVTIVMGWADPLFGAFMTLLGNIPGWLASLGGIIKDAFLAAVDWVVANAPTIWESIKGFFAGIPGKVGEWLGSLGSMLYDTFYAAALWLVQNAPAIWEKIKEIVSGIPGKVGEWLGSLGSTIKDAFVAAVTWVRDNAGTIWDTIKSVFTAVPGLIIGALGSIGELLGGWITAGWTWVTEHWTDILKGLIVSVIAVPALIILGLGKIGLLLFDWLKAGFQWVVDNGPTILSTITTWMTTIPSLLLAGITNLGSLLIGWITGAFQAVVDNGPAILMAVGTWLLALPGKILGFLGDLGGTIVGWVTGAFQWLVDHGSDAISKLTEFFTGLPGKMLDAIGSLGQWLYDNVFYPAAVFIVTEGPKIIDKIKEFITGLPGKLVEAVGNLGQWLYDHVFYPAALFIVTEGPKIIDKIKEFVTGLPGKLVDAIGNIGQWLWDHTFVPMRDFITEKLPGLIDSFVEFFKGIPGKIVDALTGAASGAVDIGKKIYNALTGFINDFVLKPLEAIDIFGQKPFEFLAQHHLLPLAEKGGLFNTPVIAGEAGLEAIIPLTDPMRAVQVAVQAGLPAMLLKAGVLGPNASSFSLPRLGATTSAPTPAPIAASVAASGPVDNSVTMNNTIIGVSFEQALAEIQAKQDAELRSRRRG